MLVVHIDFSLEEKSAVALVGQLCSGKNKQSTHPCVNSAKAPAFGPFNQQGERIIALDVETTYVLATPDY